MGGAYLIDGLGLADTGEVIEEFRGDAGIGYRLTVGIVGGVTVVDGSGVCCEVCDDSGHIEGDIVSAASDTFADGVGVWVVGGDLVIVEQQQSVGGGA
jgi:hypothetical protein